MLNEYQINALPERIVKRLERINSDYLIAIGERIKEIGDLRPTEVHQLQRIYKNTRNIDAISAQLAALSDKTEKEIYDIFETVAKENYDYSEPFFKAQGKPFVPFSQNKELKDYVQAVARQTVGEFKNLAQHTAFMVFGKNGEVVPTYFGMSNKVPTSLSETYTKITDLAIQKVQMGTESYQSAMREVMRTMADSGIRTVEYATGYSRRLDTAVRQNILWGVKQCNQETADMVGKAFGADGVEISYHSNPRESHADMGGRQYAIGKAKTVNGIHYPSFDTVKHLLDEYNCLHFKFSILLGVSEPAYDADELEQLKANDRKTFTYEGKKYTGYEATQAQRKLETAFRHSSDRYTIAKAAGDKDMMLKEQTRMTQISQKYNEFSKTAGLPTKVERLSSGVRLKASSNEYTKMVRNDKAKLMRRNAKSDKAQYEKYISVLGKENMPKTFDLFQDLKYNNRDEWEDIKYYALNINGRPIECVKIDRELLKLGVNRGKCYPTDEVRAYILPDKPSAKEPYHIMVRMRERHITDDEVRNYKENAPFMFVQWGGKRRCYYSNEGISVISNNNGEWVYKTAWKCDDFDEEVLNVLKVVNKYVKQA